VRAYAIDTLALADDGELVLYLLQLVQALKYENNADDQNRLSDLKQFKSTGSKGTNSLAGFLIDRASKNIELANYLYW
jgi:phosphatidylinositol 3-kinase